MGLLMICILSLHPLIPGVEHASLGRGLSNWSLWSLSFLKLTANSLVKLSLTVWDLRHCQVSCSISFQWIAVEVEHQNGRMRIHEVSSSCLIFLPSQEFHTSKYSDILLTYCVLFWKTLSCPSSCPVQVLTSINEWKNFNWMPVGLIWALCK